VRRGILESNPALRKFCHLFLFFFGVLVSPDTICYTVSHTLYRVKRTVTHVPKFGNLFEGDGMPTKIDWDWGVPNGHPDRGLPTDFTTETSDGYEITLTLQENEDGVIICSGISIKYLKNKDHSPDNPINSRYFQLLGLGSVLSSAREAYAGWADILNEVYSEMEIERSLEDWTPLGNQGFPDEKYAAVAYMYVKFVRQGLENPVTALAENFKWDKNTASSRVMEARARDLLTKPKVGTFGGRLTKKAELLLEI